LLLNVKQAVFHSKQNYFTPFPLYILIYQAVWLLLEQSTKPSSTGKISHQIGSFNIAFVLKVN
jgi:hypothetical protein